MKKRLSDGMFTSALLPLRWHIGLMIVGLLFIVYGACLPSPIQ